MKNNIMEAWVDPGWFINSVDSEKIYPASKKILGIWQKNS